MSEDRFLFVFWSSWKLRLNPDLNASFRSCLALCGTVLFFVASVFGRWQSFRTAPSRLSVFTCGYLWIRHVCVFSGLLLCFCPAGSASVADSFTGTAGNDWSGHRWSFLPETLSNLALVSQTTCFCLFIRIFFNMVSGIKVQSVCLTRCLYMLAENPPLTFWSVDLEKSVFWEFCSFPGNIMDNTRSRLVDSFRSMNLLQCWP